MVISSLSARSVPTGHQEKGGLGIDGLLVAMKEKGAGRALDHAVTTGYFSFLLAQSVQRIPPLTPLHLQPRTLAAAHSSVFSDRTQGLPDHGHT
jgi:hypothetical protein